MAAAAITSIYIPHVEGKYTAQFISDTLFSQGLATVSKISLIPNLQKAGYLKAYVDIAKWHDTEAAFSFLDRIRHAKKEARLNYISDKWWVVSENKIPYATSMNYWQQFTTHFAMPIEEDIDNMDEIELAMEEEEKDLWTELERLIQEEHNTRISEIDLEAGPEPESEPEQPEQQEPIIGLTLNMPKEGYECLCVSCRFNRGNYSFPLEDDDISYNCEDNEGAYTPVPEGVEHVKRWGIMY